MCLSRMTYSTHRTRALRQMAVCITLLAAVATAARAQGPVAGAASGGLAGCTSDRCALRLNYGFGGDGVRVGLDGPTTGMGMTGCTLSRMVAPVPAARIEAERGWHQRTRGLVAGLISASVLSSLSVAAVAQVDMDPGQVTALIGGSIATLIYGAVQGTRASQSFSRAVWLYNREIPR